MTGYRIETWKTHGRVARAIIKGSSTLRVSSKGKKPSPRTVYYEGGKVVRFKIFWKIVN